jgi:hypothetical protein
VTGTLGLFSLVDLFQLLASSKRTGRLLVEHPEGAARVFFDKGRIVHAEFAGAQGVEAVYTLFADERGSFEFTLGLPAPQVSIQVSTENLLLEAIRRVDEHRRETPGTQALSGDAVLTVSEGAAGLTLNAQETEVLRLMDGQRDLKQLVHSSGLEPSRTREVVGRLLKLGAAVVRRKPRIARLVAQLAREPLAAGHVGIDSNILYGWERMLGYPPTRVACRRPDGRVDLFAAEAMEVGPYILFSRDTLLTLGLAANTTLLVRPVMD